LQKDHKTVLDLGFQSELNLRIKMEYSQFINFLFICMLLL